MKTTLTYEESTMKTVVWFAALLIGVGVNASANMITNPGFESTDTAGNPIGWTSATVANATPSYSATGGDPDGYVGISAGGASGENTRYWQQPNVSVQPSTTYALSFDYQTDCVNTLVRVDYWGGAGESNWQGFALFGDTTQWGNASLNYTSGWTHWSGSTNYANTFTTGAGVNYLTIKLVQNAGWGSAAFDNITLVPEPFSLALFGVGIGVMAMRRRR